MDFINLSPPDMSGEEMKYIQSAFDTNWIAPLGGNVDEFEYRICNYLGYGHGLALSSGTAGIHLALKYLGAGPGDTVFCSSLTFAASANPIVYQGAQPVFIDSDFESWNMSPGALLKAFEWAQSVGRLPKAVIVVDLYGQSADWDKLLPICRHYGVPVVEDAAEALGAEYNGRKCGTFGDISVLSFNGNKIITTSGGGMVVSPGRQAIEKMRYWATQAREPMLHYEHREVGYNYRLSNICAGIGLGQLEGLEDKVARKTLISEKYAESFTGLPVAMMPVAHFGKPNYWLSVITIDQGSGLAPVDIISALRAKNIETRPIWMPMNLQPVFSECPFFSSLGDGSVGEALFNTGVCLPSGSGLTGAEQERVISAVVQCFRQTSKKKRPLEKRIKA